MTETAVNRRSSNVAAGWAGREVHAGRGAGGHPLRLSIAVERASKPAAMSRADQWDDAASASAGVHADAVVAEGTDLGEA